MSKTFALSITVCLALAACQTPPTAPQGKPADIVAIQQVVESRRTSLIDKDKPIYMALFFSSKPVDIGWQFVSEDTRLARIRQSKPDAIKARQIPGKNFVSLIDEVVATAEPREETFANVRIDTDGDIASAPFDYAFIANGQTTNWGKQLWQLVRTEAGWKIFSVVYSIRDEWTAPAH